LATYYFIPWFFTSPPRRYLRLFHCYVILFFRFRVVLLGRICTARRVDGGVVKKGGGMVIVLVMARQRAPRAIHPRFNTFPPGFFSGHNRRRLLCAFPLPLFCLVNSCWTLTSRVV
jgi:hypothetical protein